MQSVSENSGRIISNGGLKAGVAAMGVLLGASGAWGATARSVVDYDLGTNPHANPGYKHPEAALGETSRNTGYSIFGGGTYYLSNPYNNPWRAANASGASPHGDWVSIGRSGFITLEMETYAYALDDAPELNVLVFQQVLSSSNGVSVLYDRQASVAVSEDGVDWYYLNGGDPISFDIPATGYVFPDSIPQDSTGGFGAIDAADLHLYQESDYTLVMPGELDYSSKAAFEASRAAAYGLSGGGNWLDISETGLDRILYVKFEVAEDAPFASGMFALDAVYINQDALEAPGGGPVTTPVPEPASVGLLALAGGLLVLRRRRVG